MTLLTVALLICFTFSLLELRGIRDKTSQIFLGIESLLLFILMGLNRMNQDYRGYYGSYYNGNPNHEIGYQLLNKLLKAVHAPFETLMALMAILLITVFWVGMKNQISTWPVFFYAIFPLALDLPQMRNTFMYLIVILALLIFGNRNRLGYLVSVLVAASLHILGLIYLPLAFLLQTNRKTFYKWLKIILLILLAGVVGIRVANAVWTLNPEISEEIKGIDRFFIATQLVEIAIDLFTYWWVDRKIQAQVDQPTADRLENMYRFGFYSVIYLPLLLISSQMYRIRRNAQLVKYLYSGIALKYMNRKDQLILIGLILVNLALVIILMFMAHDQIVYTWFDQNWLIQSLKRLGIR
jgi:hypothetical protein